MKNTMREINYKEIRSRRCLVCHRPNVDVCHIQSRGAGGSDEEHNLMPLCRLHHQEQHQKGIVTFARKHLSVGNYLASHGWEIKNNKLRRDYDEKTLEQNQSVISEESRTTND